MTIDRDQRRAWVEARVRMGLDGGASTEGRWIYKVGVRVAVLPSDPLINAVDFNDEVVLMVLSNSFEGWTAGSLSHLREVRRTAGAVLRLSRGADGAVEGYVGLRP